MNIAIAEIAQVQLMLMSKVLLELAQRHKAGVLVSAPEKRKKKHPKKKAVMQEKITHPKESAARHRLDLPEQTRAQTLRTLVVRCAAHK